MQNSMTIFSGKRAALQGGIMNVKEHISQNRSSSSGSKTLTEQEKTEYADNLDDLCAALEKYSAILSKQISIITGTREKMEKLQITGRTEEH